MSDQSITPPPATQDDLFARFAVLGIETTTHRHAAVFTVEENQTSRGEIPGAHCKSLFFKDKKGVLWLVVALEDRRLDFKLLARLIGAARLTFASPDRLRTHLGIEPGAVTPFALINDAVCQVRVVLDAAMMAAEFANFHPLSNDATTSIRPRDLSRFITDCGHHAAIVDLDDAAHT